MRTTLDSGATRAMITGALIGALFLAVALIWRSSRQDTIVLEVAQAPDPNVVRVYVGGAVNAPGLYSLARGSRVSDAIDAAGGLAPAADTTGLGLAAPLEDADQVIVGTRAPVSTGIEPAVAVAGTNVANPSPPANGIVNVNVAPQSELESLPGIGPTLAERIIAHREQYGPFQTVDELVAIDGISERIVNELRPRITVGP
jgi:competence protein ComEA